MPHPKETNQLAALVFGSAFPMALVIWLRVFSGVGALPSSMPRPPPPKKNNQPAGLLAFDAASPQKTINL